MSNENERVGQFGEFPIIVRTDCPQDTVYFLSKGSKTMDIATGKTLEVTPGYYVNPRSMGKITNVRVP